MFHITNLEWICRNKIFEFLTKIDAEDKDCFVPTAVNVFRGDIHSGLGEVPGEVSLGDLVIIIVWTPYSVSISDIFFGVFPLHIKG